MKLKTHGRYDYSAITERKDYRWPEGKRLAVHLCLNVEHFSFGEGLGSDYAAPHPPPNHRSFAWRDYGNRVGAWRLLELAEAYDLPYALLVNTELYDYCPQMVAAFSRRGDEIVGHGRTNSEHQNDFDEAGERRLIDEVTAAIERHEGSRPLGWISPGVNPSVATTDLLQEAGYTYLLDWPIDDQPVWMSTRSGGRILNVPYPHEVNDVPMIALHHGTAPAFADMVVDNFDEMLRQSEKQSLVYGVSIHTFLLGQPFRIARFRRALEHIVRHRDRVWFTTPGEIARHYIDAVSSNGR